MIPRLPKCPKCNQVMDLKDLKDRYFFCQYCEIIWDAKNPTKTLDHFPDMEGS